VAALIERVEAEGFGEEPGLDGEAHYAITGAPTSTTSL